jgi:predicted DNA-binding WGR domain protein
MSIQHIILKIANKYPDLERLRDIRENVKRGMVQSFTLYFTEGTSNKFWGLDIQNPDDGFALVKWGRIGTPGREQMIEVGPAFDRAIKKIQKGYTFDEPGSDVEEPEGVLPPDIVYHVDGYLEEYVRSFESWILEDAWDIAVSTADILKRIEMHTGKEMGEFFNTICRAILYQAKLADNLVKRQFKELAPEIREAGLKVPSVDIYSTAEMDVRKAQSRWNSTTARLAFWSSPKTKSVRKEVKELKYYLDRLYGTWDGFSDDTYNFIDEFENAGLSKDGAHIIYRLQKVIFDAGDRLEREVSNATKKEFDKKIQFYLRELSRI